MTTQVDPTSAAIEDLYADMVWTPLTNSLIAMVFAAVPWLAIIPLSWIVSALIKALMGLLLKLMRLGADDVLIYFKNASHRAAFDDATVELKLLANEKGINSSDYLNNKQNARDSLSQFVAFIGQ